MKTLPASTPTTTFIVRIWRETSLSGPHWRGYILEVNCGRKTWFQKMGAIEEFIRRSSGFSEGQINGREQPEDLPFE